MSLLFSPFKNLFYQLYLLQLENYSLRRFVRTALHRLGRESFPPRKGLVWTGKLKLLFALGLFLQITSAHWLGVAVAKMAGVETPSAYLFEVFFLYALCYVAFIFFALATVITVPIDVVIKGRIIKKAKRKLAARTDLIIIAITGSYGKTTMKEVMATVLAGKFNVLKTPESINTPLGVARLILSSLTEKTQIFIVEMGAYYRGDIASLCALTPPDIAVLTGINESHLERFKNIGTTIATKFEIIDCLKKDGIAVLNADDERVREEYDRRADAPEVRWYSAHNHSRAETTVERSEFLDNGMGVSFLLQTQRAHYHLATPLLASYALGTISAAAVVAEHLGMTPEGIEAGVALIKPVPHRLEIRRVPGDVLIIDDSYNGNPEGVREAIEVLGRFAGRRKIYLTPGLVEMGKRTQEVHRAIGNQLKNVADVVLLIDNSVTGFIRQGLEEEGFAPENIRVFSNARQAHTSLPDILKPGDVILFQNDWPEGYV